MLSSTRAWCHPPGRAYPHIKKTPGVCGGKACIDGTRIRVMDIVVLHEQGLPPFAYPVR